MVEFHIAKVKICENPGGENVLLTIVTSVLTEYDVIGFTIERCLAVHNERINKSLAEKRIFCCLSRIGQPAPGIQYLEVNAVG